MRTAKWAFCVLIVTVAGHLNAAEPATIELRVEALLERMTVEEKLGVEFRRTGP